MSVIRQQDEMLKLTKTRQIHHRSPKRSLAPVSARVKPGGRLRADARVPAWRRAGCRGLDGPRPAVTSAIVADKDWPIINGHRLRQREHRYSLGIRISAQSRHYANVTSRRSPLVDRRHAKVWISMGQPPLTRSRGRPRGAILPQAVIRPYVLNVRVVNLGLNPFEGGAAQPPPGRPSSQLTARLARIWQARRLPRCRDSAPCFPASCARASGLHTTRLLSH